MGYGFGPMALCDVQVTLETTSGVPENRIVNTWHFDDGESGTSAFLGQLETFYKAIVTLYPSYITQSGHGMKVYRVSDPVPRAPIADTTWAFTGAPTGGSIPLECCMVLSYQAEQVSGVPQPRRRGRVYLGPMKSTGFEADGRLAAALMTVVRNAADALLDASKASATWKWSTHSRVLATGDEVLSGWIDNEPDTQRRRGREATSRLTFN